jgi:alpha-L-fucosidase
MHNSALPSEQHVQWADMELGVIIHLCADIIDPSFRDIKNIKVRQGLPPEKFTVQDLDTDQWLKAASDLGAGYAILVANHCTGFSLWPTGQNDYSVKRSPWKNGRGDIVRDFIDSCSKFNIRPGLYYSTGCNGYYDIDDSRPDYSSAKYHEYVKVVEAQIEELWRDYGELFEIWFDGGIVPLTLGGPNLVPLLEKYQPNALCFQGPNTHLKNLRWVGNEDGMAPRNCWSTSNFNSASYDGNARDELAGKGDPDGMYWIPAETDMPNRTHAAFGGGWLWKEGEISKQFSIDELMDCYYTSVGRNSNLLIGMAIGTNGLFEDTEQFKLFGERVRNTFANAAASIEGRGAYHEIVLKDPKEISHIVLMEDIRFGHRVRSFHIETESVDGRKIVGSDDCIGHKRIVRIEPSVVSKVILYIDAFTDEPLIRSFSIY